MRFSVRHGIMTRRFTRTVRFHVRFAYKSQIAHEIAHEIARVTNPYESPCKRDGVDACSAVSARCDPGLGIVLFFAHASSAPGGCLVKSQNRILLNVGLRMCTGRQYDLIFQN
jgi:hypothetical protein